jgi:hypothetical protein
MRKEQVKTLVEKKLSELGVAEHLSAIKPVPSKTELTVAMGGVVERMTFRSGITEFELKQKLEEFEGRWKQRMVDGQMDVEDYV